MKRLLLTLTVGLLLMGCAEQEADGVYVELSLENDADIGSYVVFNPNLKTIEECEASVQGALSSILANMPPAIPKNSKVTGWECSLTNPAEGKTEKPS
ncbi:MAG: hypothetical protein JSW48_11295 [Betaproteobacteria bacterium]|nr:MAG: hypothetical protein JSW48_11295 [Betaproteobacteria bacterium]